MRVRGGVPSYRTASYDAALRVWDARVECRP